MYLDSIGGLYVYSGQQGSGTWNPAGSLKGDSDDHYNTYVIGLNSGGDRIRFDSTRIFFPDVLEHAQHLTISNAAYALINFTYYIEVKTFNEI